MKLTKLASSYLEFMINSYMGNHKNIFSWEVIKELHPDQDDEFICDALRLLCNDGLIRVFWADIAYTCSLEINAIRDAEENTTLRTTYKVLKELKSWI